MDNSALNTKLNKDFNKFTNPTKLPSILFFESYLYVVVVAYHVTIVEIGHGLLKKLGCVLRTAGSSII